MIDSFVVDFWDRFDNRRGCGAGGCEGVQSFYGREAAGSASCSHCRRDHRFRGCFPGMLRGDEGVLPYADGCKFAALERLENLMVLNSSLRCVF